MSRLLSGTVSGSGSKRRRAGSAPPGGALPGALFGVVADHGQVGQGEHRKRDVAVLPDPRPDLVLVQPDFTLGLLDEARRRLLGGRSNAVYIHHKRRVSQGATERAHRIQRGQGDRLERLRGGSWPGWGQGGAARGVEGFGAAGGERTHRRGGAAAPWRAYASAIDVEAVRPPIRQSTCLSYRRQPCS